MQRLFPRPLALLAIAALMAPSAAATWYAYGSHEPDNALDNEEFMRFDPPGVATNLIYFNVVTGMSSGLRGIMASPNVALLETHTEIPTSETHQALFGVWIDCNGDGYVGIAEGAMREYPSSLLLNEAICPAITGSNVRWTAGAHNYNGWVSELVPIAGTPFGITTNTTDLRVYEDIDAMVWGDYNRPNDPALGGGTCPTAPQPRGTWQSTGGFINYADCSTGLMDRWNEVWFGRTLANQSIDGLYSYGAPNMSLHFYNVNNASGHPIYDRPTLGSEDTQYSPAYVYDCSAPRTHSGDTLNATPLGPSVPAAAQNISVPAISPSLGTAPPTQWTVPAFVNHTFEGTPGIRPSADCDTSNDRGADVYGNNYVFYVGETDVNPVTAANKRAANFNFQFQYWDRGTGVLGIGPATPGLGGPAGAALPGKPQSNWNNGASTTKTPATLRVDITQGTYEIPGAYYLSFYAAVGENTTERGFLTPGGEGVYGSAQCGSNTSGIHNGWNCDRDAWYRNADGSPVASPTLLARPGDKYQFRDVDCFDGGITQLGIGIGTPYYGSRACELP
ncbi:MAG TPA: hypothetical protein VFH78_01250 [Candidatus Thermoplasmatota archaeon]|nr:hypothetical protein [Candidatus Thermoplasmatota archaeon]